MDNYQRIRKLGKGSFGDVLLVQRISDQEMFALKRIDLRDMDSFTIDPKNEVKVLKSLDHPNIIKYFDTFMHNSKLCILMEYADNGDLCRKIKDHRLMDTGIDEEQLCLAVHYLHGQKVLHRDIKVQNVFLSSNGLVKLGDFGISKILEHTTELAKTSIGTPYYLSPEICDSTEYNHKIDIWMLGCTLYELCTLQKPFLGDSINAVVHKIMNDQPDPIPSSYSKFTIDLVEQMLKKKPDNRPEVLTVLQMPQLQKELIKLRGLYQQLGIKTSLPIMKIPLQIKLRSEANEGDEEKKSNGQFPTPLSSSKYQKSPVGQKIREISIHQLVEQSKLQMKLHSPHHQKRSARRTPTHSQPPTSTKLEQQLNEEAVSLFSGVKEQAREFNSPHFKQVMAAPRTNKSTINENEEDIQGQKQRPYQRLISINTQLEVNYVRKEPSSATAVNEQKTLIKPQSFAFEEQIFDPNVPASPNRTILFSAFLKRKLGESKFNLMKIVNKMGKLLEQSSDPIELLDNQKQRVASIIGPENLDCIKVLHSLTQSINLQMFKFLITSSITPSASHFRTKSAQIFSLNAHQPNLTALSSLPSPNNQQYEGSSGLLELLQDVEIGSVAKNIGLNEGFEISFKNFKDFQD